MIADAAMPLTVQHGAKAPAPQDVHRRRLHEHRADGRRAGQQARLQRIQAEADLEQQRQQERRRAEADAEQAPRLGRRARTSARETAAGR